jgi:hypothetical protein
VANLRKGENDIYVAEGRVVFRQRYTVDKPLLKIRLLFQNKASEDINILLD